MTELEEAFIDIFGVYSPIQILDVGYIDFGYIARVAFVLVVLIFLLKTIGGLIYGFFKSRG